jgi:hypothetical protein
MALLKHFVRNRYEGLLFRELWEYAGVLASLIVFMPSDN